MTSSTSTLAPPALVIDHLRVGYGPIIAVQDVSLEVMEAEAVCLIGANGAGKTTLLKAISGLLRPQRGSIRFQDHNIAGARPSVIARRGISLVPEGREVLPSLSVTENLIAGTFAARGEGASIDEVIELFPRLGDRLDQRAATLSGGEQQMLAIARALMARPSLLLLDEPSMGLAPLVVAALFEKIEQVIQSGVTTLLVEQNARMALSVAQRGYVMAHGEIVATGAVDDLRHDQRIHEAYLGAGE